MSDSTRARLAVLQHAHKQAAASRAVSVISERLAEEPHRPVDAELSLKVQVDLSKRLRGMRAAGTLRSSRFSSAEEAVTEFCRRGSSLGARALVQFYSHSGGSGFFEGAVSSDFVHAWLESAREGLVVAAPDLSSGVMIDVALDDPLLGSFLEVEWW